VAALRPLQEPKHPHRAKYSSRSWTLQQAVDPNRHHDAQDHGQIETDQRAEGDGDEHAQRADDERDPRAERDAGPEVPAVEVGAEDVAPGGGVVLQVDDVELCARVERRHERRRHGDDREEREDPDPPGGGGVPVMELQGGTLKGIDAVIDKDIATAVLANTIGAAAFIDLTSSEKVYINFGKPNQKAMDRLTVSEAKKYLSAGEFAPGSMGPKIEAAIGFLKAGGKEVIITTSELLESAMEGKAGTRIVK